MKLKNFIIILFLLQINICSTLAQNLVEDATSIVTNENVFKETIKIISNSKKIFIISNNNQQLGPGDFLSLALDDKLAARALVAKLHQGQVGIKILKIYSLKTWGNLKKDLEIQIVKGDDSTFEKSKEPKVEPEATGDSKIKSEEDLFAKQSSSKDVAIKSVIETDEDISELDESKNRNIRPDNIAGIFAGFFDADEVASKGGAVRSNEFGITWAYQFADNFFIEGGYGRVLLDSFPGDGIQTLVNHVMTRLKYNFKGPLYTFILPYVGYQTFIISSPDAGKTTSQTVNDEELLAVNNLNRTGVVFGVTILRRLVPGWFVKADLGTDMINAGFAIEF